MSSAPHQKPKIIVIVGPTASGKTALSIKIAKKIGGEIISADSRQIYREMDIGTAKPVLETSDKKQGIRKTLPPVTCRMSLEGIPHYLIDIKNPNEGYTVAEYKKDAVGAIKKIIAKGKLPILVGGTGLYVKAVVDNLDIPSVKPNPNMRLRMEKEIEKSGLEAVFKKLVSLDPEAVYIVDPKNPRRVVRALEVALTTGKPFSAQRKKHEPLFAALKIGTNPSPDVLKKRIFKRVDEMIEAGLVDEVKKLAKNYGARQAAFDAIGYREITDYLRGKTNLKKAIELIKINTWHYAKRQMTWFRKDKEILWVKSEREAEKLVEKFLRPKK